MKLLRLASLLALPVLKANAQLGVYGNLDITHLSDKSTQTSTWLYGPGLGVYYDFLHLGPVAAGADLRGNFLFANKQKYRSVLAGIRLAAKPPLLPIKPYAQASVGLGGSKYDSTSSLGTQYSNKFAYQVAGGVDFTIFPFIDFRIAELSYTRVSGTNGNPIATSVNLFPTATPANLVTIATGIVFRLP